MDRPDNLDGYAGYELATTIGILARYAIHLEGKVKTDTEIERLDRADTIREKLVEIVATLMHRRMDLGPAAAAACAIKMYEELDEAAQRISHGLENDPDA
jgi:hypothetical protein